MKMTREKAQKIMQTPMGKNDADADTLEGYFKQAMILLWIEDEGFSGKRPFGNSGWNHEVYNALGKAGVVKAKIFHDDNYPDDDEVELHDYDAANDLIREVLRHW